MISKISRDVHELIRTIERFNSTNDRTKTRDALYDSLDFDLSGPYIHFKFDLSSPFQGTSWKRTNLRKTKVLLYFLEAGGMDWKLHISSGFFFLAFPLILNGMENIYSVYPIHCNFLWGVYYKKLHNQYWNLLASYHTMYNQYWNMCV